MIGKKENKSLIVSCIISASTAITTAYRAYLKAKCFDSRYIQLEIIFSIRHNKRRSHFIHIIVCVCLCTCTIIKYILVINNKLPMGVRLCEYVFVFDPGSCYSLRVPYI